MVPEGILQVGCVVTVAVGAIGDAGCAFTVTLEDATEVQEPFETVKVQVPAARLVKLAEVPDPVMVAPLDVVAVQVPDAGNPVRETVPVATVQVGCALILAVGAEGVVGCALTVKVAALLRQPSIFFAVRL